jgi:16S rRNA (cytidine1402-2'-O)-methyltransferase
LPAHEFVFLGFLPHKKGRETLLKEIAAAKRASVFYESPHRVGKALAALAKALPADRQVAVARELTKIYEQFEKGSAVEISARIASGAIPARGEFVVIVYPR